LKLPRLLAVISIVVGTSLFSLPFANATSAYTTVVCANAQGQTHTAQIGWDNNQSFFDGKGYIPAFYCTGRYAGQYNIYVSDNLSDSSLGYYAGLVPKIGRFVGAARARSGDRPRGDASARDLDEELGRTAGEGNAR
jgi:hypothetical protein